MGKVNWREWEDDLDARENEGDDWKWESFAVFVAVCLIVGYLMWVNP